MSSTDAETCKRVHAFLRQKCQAPSMKLPDAWVDGCVSWYKNSHQNTNIQDLLDFVTQQWWLVDFQQLNLRSLPVNLQKTVLVNLTENYVLQLVYVLNVGQSAYSQHQKITRGLESNSEVSADKKIPSKWEPKGRRMLLLELTDGTQTIQAMEYLPIPTLHLDLIPGTKILIKGPVECRRGMILLRSSNVELLGGEVSDLVNTYAPENVLARLIGKPENPNPVYGSYTAQTAAIPDMEQDGDDEFSCTGASSCSNSGGGGGGGGGFKERQRHNHPQGGGGGRFASSGNLNHHQGPRPSSSSAAAASAPPGIGREKRSFDDNKAIVCSPESAGPPAKKIQSLPSTAPMMMDDDDLFPDDDDDILLMAADISLEVVSTTTTTDRSEQATAGQPPEDVERSRQPALLPRPSILTRPSPAPVRRPFTYLSAHLRLRAADVDGSSTETACVKGFVSTIRGKLEARDGHWRLAATINDGSAALDVDFGSQILDQLIGNTPAAMRAMYSSEDEHLIDLAQKALQNAKERLIRLNCLLHIRWPSPDVTSPSPVPSDSAAEPGQVQQEPAPPPPPPKPTIYRMEEIERRHLEMLQLWELLSAGNNRGTLM